MKTIEINVTATEDGNLVMSTPTDLTPGEYRAVLVIEEQPVAPNKNGKTKGKVNEATNKPDEQEMAEILEAVAETETGIAAGRRPTEEELALSKIPYKPDPEELAELQEAIAQNKAERAAGIHITQKDIEQMVAEMAAEHQLKTDRSKG